MKHSKIPIMQSHRFSLGQAIGIFGVLKNTPRTLVRGRFLTYSFTCYGHENITCKHKTTLEFTKDNNLSLKGDCIVGVKADFSLVQLKKFIKSLGNNNKITIIIETINNNSNNENKIKDNKNKTNRDYKKIVEKINAEINTGFNSANEMVIRKTDFISERTLAVKADKATFELDKGLIKFLQQPSSRIKVILNREKE